jgi:hypothetical protein
MIRVLFSKTPPFAWACVFSALTLCSAAPVTAAVETDPAALYQTMKEAYDQSAVRGWSFEAQSYYLATILDAGRAYALFRENDPHYGEVAELTVDVATQLHYNPLTNDDGALWYVREAAEWVRRNDASEAVRAARAAALLERVNVADGDAARTAQVAEEDAVAAAAAFRGDPDALVQVIIADARAYQLTHDVRYRRALLAYAADPKLSLLRVPGPEQQMMLTLAAQAANAVAGYDQDEIAAGKKIQERRARTPALQEIGHVRAIPHGLRMTRTAPADEYFGGLGFSPIAIDNEIARLNRYLDLGWGTRKAQDVLHIGDAVDQWQKRYPRDITLPRRIAACYKLLTRVGDTQTAEAAARLKNTLLVEYAGTGEARELSALQ